MGFIHEGVRFESELMNEAERLRDLLDGSMDPSELESYTEYYKLAERIYGSEALDEIGIISPKEVEEKLKSLPREVIYPDGMTAMEYAHKLAKDANERL